MKDLPTLEQYKKLYGPYVPPKDEKSKASGVTYTLKTPLQEIPWDYILEKIDLCAVASSARKKAVVSSLGPQCEPRAKMLSVLGLCEADTAYNLENLKK